MSTWATVAAAKFFEQQNMMIETWARAEQKHKRLTAQAPVFWTNIKQALQAQVTSFNECVGKEVLIAVTVSDYKLQIHARTGVGKGTMIAVFDEKACSITCSACPPEGEATFQECYPMDLDCQHKIVSPSPTGIERTPDEIAARMLNGLMGWK